MVASSEVDEIPSSKTIKKKSSKNWNSPVVEWEIHSLLCDLNKWISSQHILFKHESKYKMLISWNEVNKTFFEKHQIEQLCRYFI